MPAISEDLRFVTLSHMKLRRFIGWIGLTTPFLLLIGGPVFFATDQRIWGTSISAHYWAPYLGGVFSGALSAVGVFLLFYQGYPRNQGEHYFGKGQVALADLMARSLSDAQLARIAGIGAVVTGLVPTCAPGKTCAPLSLEGVMKLAHLAGAAVFLGALAWMAFFHFTRTRQSPADWLPEDRARKTHERRVHAAIGVFMMLCLVLIPASELLGLGRNVPPGSYGPVFWLEALAIWAFGLSWMLKGEEEGSMLRGLLRMDAR